VLTRKELEAQGLDAGATSILLTLQAAEHRLPEWGLAAGEPWPVMSTIHRQLVRAGLIVAAPRKRPRSACHRFTYERPNECWQSDWTEWALADDSPVAIAGTLDDHSRLLCGLQAGPGDGTSALVWAAMTDAIARWGIPAMSLTDNGLCYSAARRAGHQEAAFEANLRVLGVHTITSSPYHPQTCGKIERFWQTLKKWLRARPAPRSLAELQALLDEFVAHYNHHRRHTAIGRRTPAAVWEAGTKAQPASRPLPAPVLVTQTITSYQGHLTVRPWMIGMGKDYAHRSITAIRQNTHVDLFDGTTLICSMDLDPTKRYQPAPLPKRPQGRRSKINP
jgi:transposase InsO family protein